MVPCTDALQVKHRPYMSPSEIPYTGEDGVGLHRQLESNLADIAQRGKKAARKGIRLGHKVGMTNKQATASYFWNCTCTVAAPHGLLMFWPNAHLRLRMADNTVEMVLLGCAVLVNLAGVMFESNRFQSEHFNDQRDGVTIFIMMVIIASIVYYVTVVTSEIYVTLYPEKSSRGCWYAARHCCLCWCWQVTLTRPMRLPQHAPTQTSTAESAVVRQIRHG